jgi:hypothetical protein
MVSNLLSESNLAEVWWLKIRLTPKLLPELALSYSCLGRHLSSWLENQTLCPWTTLMARRQPIVETKDLLLGGMSTLRTLISSSRFLSKKTHLTHTFGRKEWCINSSICVSMTVVRTRRAVFGMRPMIRGAFRVVILRPSLPKNR